MTEIDLRPLSGENEEQFIWRIGQLKDSGKIDLDWNDIADIINKYFRNDVSEYRTEAAYRKPYQYTRNFIEKGIFVEFGDEYIQKLNEIKESARKEKQKLFDERVALNKILREQARRESVVDIVRRTIDEYDRTVFDYVPHKIEDSGNDLIIHLTDIHCGVEIDNALNKFDSDILKERLQKYLDEIFEIQETYKAQNAFIILGGDLMQGLIHINARIEAKEDVIEQIMIVSDLISNFINEIGKRFEKVNVYSTAGNHGRAVASKEQAVGKENLDLLVPFICKKDLKNIENIEFYDNELNYDIATFEVRGHMVYATHGDKDTVSNVVYNMTKFARKVKLPLPDICYLGHRHANGLTTVDDVKVIESGCVDGMDSYAISKRLVGTAEQTVTVVSENKKIKALCDIQIE